MSQNYFSAIILAAGKGRRMLSDTPKVMHKIGGKPMLQHLIDSIIKIDVKTIYIIYGYKGKEIIKKIGNKKYKKSIIHWIPQNPLNGTGHAVQQALPMINDDEEILILYGDVPLISTNTLRKLRSMKSQCDIGLLTAILPNPNGYGRIIRNQKNDVIRIIEQNNIFHYNHKKIKEINTGIFITIAKNLKFWLTILTTKKRKNELYLTDIINIAYRNGNTIHTIKPNDVSEIIGINNKSNLIDVERKYQKKQALLLLKEGVIISDPNRFDLRGTLIHGKDVYIDINVIIEGNVTLGNRVKIGAGCILKHAIIKDDVIIHPFSIIEYSIINIQSTIGPFARIRPGTELQENTKVGNFVELKNTKFGKQSKANHLTYLGDADIGSQVNIGAGTIICNYDGIKKNKTIIGNNVFIGSNSQLVAPITVGDNVTIGAGTTVTKNIAEGETIISRIRQFSIANLSNINKKRI